MLFTFSLPSKTQVFSNALLKKCLQDPIPLPRAPHSGQFSMEALCHVDIGKQPIGDRAVPGHSDSDSQESGFLPNSRSRV